MTTTTVQTETLDESLSLEDLSAIHGSGVWSWLKEKAQQVSDYIEETYGDGDGKHELSDYSDEAEKVIDWLKEKAKELPYPCGGSGLTRPCS